MNRRGLRMAAGALLLGGALALGQGLYIHAKALLAQYLLRGAWADTLAGKTGVRPWPWADTWPVARLTVPGRGIDLIVLAGATGRTLAFGPGHLDGSPRPGDPGNAVISAHRDTQFHFLKDLRQGETVVVQTPDGVRHTFQVTGHAVVDSRTARIPLNGPGRHLTLTTCYPLDAPVPGGPLRYLVYTDAVSGKTPELRSGTRT